MWTAKKQKSKKKKKKKKKKHEKREQGNLFKVIVRNIQRCGASSHKYRQAGNSNGI